MDFWDFEKIYFWYDFSIKKSGFDSLEPQIKDFWKKLVSNGRCSIPPGFLASLMNRLMPLKIGRALPNKVSFTEEENYINRILESAGAEKLFNLFVFSESANKYDCFISIFEQILFRLPDFRHNKVMFLESEVNKAFEISSGKFEDKNETLFDPDIILKEIYINAENEFIESKITFKEEDIFEISHPKLFEKSSDRLFYRKMSTAIKTMSFWLRGTFTLQEESSWVVTKYGEPQTLPIGGYDELTNKGTISSMLTSELAYIDETMDFDLFDYKLIENRLLYFKRDTGSIFRIRRDFLIQISMTEFFEHEKNLGILFACIFSFASKIIEVYAKDMVKVTVLLNGYTPTSINEAAGFFNHFLLAKSMANRVSMIIQKSDEIPEEILRKEAQLCIFGPRHIKSSNFIKFIFPQDDDFAKLSQENQEQELGKLVNRMIEKMVRNEFSKFENQ